MICYNISSTEEPPLEFLSYIEDFNNSILQDAHVVVDQYSLLNTATLAKNADEREMSTDVSLS